MGEAFRLRLLRSLEEDLGWAGYRHIAGVDEVGRGSLAGPVVAAAVVPAPDVLLPAVDDSKELSAPQRAALAERIRETSAATAVVAVSASTIDRCNVLEATRIAMSRALWALAPSPDLAIIDAVRLASAPCPQIALVRGDVMSYAVSCASILAKVHRDGLMVSLDRSYPQYGFARHKGYAAQEHRAALRALGPTPEHRLTFRSVMPTRAACVAV